MQSYVLISNSYNPYLNLAVENYLLEVSKQSNILFLWRNDKTVVIGKNQNPYAECNVDSLYADKGLLARRLTGGGAVYHDEGNINFSFIMDKDDYCVERQLSVIIKALQAFGITAESNGRNDITAEGKKFSGNAFLKKKDACLHHGTLLIKLSTENMAKYLTVSKEKLYAKGVKSTASRVINLAQLCSDVNNKNLSEELIKAFEKEYGKAQELDFGELVANEKVAKMAELFQTQEFLFGKWIAEDTTTIRYEWGCLSLHKDKDDNIVCCSTDCLYPDVLEKVGMLLDKKAVIFEDDFEREIVNTIISKIAKNTAEKEQKQPKMQ